MDVNSVSFGAKPISIINIKKLDKSLNKYVDYSVNFVQIDGSNRFDLTAINTVAQKWKGATYIKKIATASHWIQTRDFVEIDVYALTAQQKNFDKLKPNKILGLAEMRNDNKNPENRILQHLQVKPSAINLENNDKKTYKRTGTAILTSLKKIYNNISLFADSPSTEKFYKKNGFIEDFFCHGHMVWSSNIFKMIKLRINRFLMQNGF